MTFRRRFLGLAAVLLLLFGSIPTASALSFTTMSLKSGSTTMYGTGSWNIDRSNGTQYRVNGKTRKTSAGGNSAYWNADLQASSGFCISSWGGDVSVSCHLEYYGYGNLQGTRFNSSSWRSSIKYKPVQANSKTASAGLKVCEDVRFWFDPCSPVGWTNGIQYRKG